MRETATIKNYCIDCKQVVERQRSLINALEEIRSTLGGLRNHLKRSEDSRAMDYVEYLVKRIGDALATGEQGGEG